MYVQDIVGGDKPNQDWKLLHCQLILPLILFCVSLCRPRHHWIKITEINISLASLEKLILNVQLKHSYYTYFSLFLFHTVVYACLLNSMIFVLRVFLFLQFMQLLQLCNTSFAYNQNPALFSKCFTLSGGDFLSTSPNSFKCTIATFCVQSETFSIWKCLWAEVMFYPGLVWSCGVVKHLHFL